MRRLIDSFAEYERLIIGARTKSAPAAKRARGERVGALPFGYRLAADGVQLEATTSSRACCPRCTAEGRRPDDSGDGGGAQGRGFTTRRGGAWRHRYIVTALKSAVVCPTLCAAA
jgi:hypothetical protein